MRYSLVLTLATLLGCAPNPVAMDGADVPDTLTCPPPGPPPGMVLVPIEVAARFYSSMNGLNQQLRVCLVERDDWQRRNDCS